MEQSVSLPAYMYIPAPIQQQIAAYQTGELLEVYKLGWKRDKRTTTTFIFLLLIMLPIGIVGAMGLEYMFANGVYLTRGILVLVAFVPGIGFSGAMTAVYFIFKGSICVCAYDNGLIYTQNMQVTWLPWCECAYLKRKTTKLSIQSDGSPGLGRIFTLQTYDGRRFRFRGRALAVDDLGKIIRGKIAH